ncbi:hypothetical protein F4861DRAFT_135380 [Xylaria intraflava]|nr:hypothetical protein F4861DRAFT_135380 [Xylaria intraflava]
MARIKTTFRWPNTPPPRDMSITRILGSEREDQIDEGGSGVDSDHSNAVVLAGRPSDRPLAPKDSSRGPPVAECASKKPTEPTVDMTPYPASAYIQSTPFYTKWLSLRGSAASEPYTWANEVTIAFIALLGDARREGLIASAGLDHIDKQNRNQLWHFIRKRFCETGFYGLVHKLSDDLLEAKYKAELESTYKPYKKLVSYRYAGLRFKMDQNGRFMAPDVLWESYFKTEGGSKDNWLCKKGMPLWQLYEAAFGDGPAPGRTSLQGEEPNPELNRTKDNETAHPRWTEPPLIKSFSSVLGTTPHTSEPGASLTEPKAVALPPELWVGSTRYKPVEPPFGCESGVIAYKPDPQVPLPNSVIEASTPEIKVASNKYKPADPSSEPQDSNNISTGNKRKRIDYVKPAGGRMVTVAVKRSQPMAATMHDARTKRMWAYEGILDLKLAPEMNKAARKALDDDFNVVDALRCKEAGSLFDWCEAELPRYL